MISFSKEFLNHPIFFQYGRVNVLMAILLSDEEGGVVELSANRLSSLTGMTPSSVLCALSDLERAGMIRVESAERIQLCVMPDGVWLKDNPVVEKRAPKEKKKAVSPSTPTHFIPPTLADVQAYVAKMGYTFDPSYFIASNEAKGWMRGKTKIKNWKALCRTWQVVINNSNNGNKYDQSRKERRDLFARAEAQTTQLSDSAITDLLPSL